MNFSFEVPNWNTNNAPCLQEEGEGGGGGEAAEVDAGDGGGEEEAGGAAGAGPHARLQRGPGQDGADAEAAAAAGRNKTLGLLLFSPERIALLPLGKILVRFFSGVTIFICYISAGL